jgi:hypothetical protein
MPAKSEKQRKFFGIAKAIKQGKEPKSYSKAAAKVAKELPESEIDKFAKKKKEQIENYKTLIAAYRDLNKPSKVAEYTEALNQIIAIVEADNSVNNEGDQDSVPKNSLVLKKPSKIAKNEVGLSSDKEYKGGHEQDEDSTDPHEAEYNEIVLPISKMDIDAFKKALLQGSWTVGLKKQRDDYDPENIRHDATVYNKWLNLSKHNIQYYLPLLSPSQRTGNPYIDNVWHNLITFANEKRREKHRAHHLANNDPKYDALAEKATENYDKLMHIVYEASCYLPHLPGALNKLTGKGYANRWKNWGNFITDAESAGIVLKK